MTEQNGGQGHWPLPDQHGSSEPSPQTEASENKSGEAPAGQDATPGTSSTPSQEAETPALPADVPPDVLESGRSVVFGQARRHAKPPEASSDPGTRVAGGEGAPAGESAPPPFGQQGGYPGPGAPPPLAAPGEQGQPPYGQKPYGAPGPG